MAVLESGDEIALPDCDTAQVKTIGVRPEDIQIGDGGIAASIFHVEELGETRIAHVRLGNTHELAVRSRGLDADATQAGIKLHFPADRLHLFDREDRRVAGN